MGITTKRGDEGMTDLLFGGSVPKTHLQVEALGMVDELNAFLGFVRVTVEGEVGDLLDRIQAILVTLMGEVATPEHALDRYESSSFGRVSKEDVTFLEENAAAYDEARALKRWLRPGSAGGEVAARLHLARTVARRAERSLWALPEAIARKPARLFLNRLSDLLWLLARAVEEAKN